MTEIALSEFPFVSELPKREQKRVRSAWDVVREFSELQEREGALLPAAVAAAALGVSRQRVFQIMDDGRLQRVEFEGHVFVTEKSLIELGRQERKTGRPFNVDLETRKGCLKAGAICLGESVRAAVGVVRGKK